MPNYPTATMKAVDELPPRRPHYTKLRVEARALVVARNSRKGKWTAYAHYKNKDAAVSAGYKIRNRSEFRTIGDPKTEYRFDPNKNVWVIFLRFDDLTISDVDLVENINDIGGREVLDREEIRPLDVMDSKPLT